MDINTKYVQTKHKSSPNSLALFLVGEVAKPSKEISGSLVLVEFSLGLQ